MDRAESPGGGAAVRARAFSQPAGALPRARPGARRAGGGTQECCRCGVHWGARSEDRAGQGAGGPSPEHQRSGDLSAPPGVHHRRRKTIWAQVLASPEQSFRVPKRVACSLWDPSPQRARFRVPASTAPGEPETSCRPGPAARPSTHPTPESDEGGSEKHWPQSLPLKVCRPER